MKISGKVHCFFEQIGTFKNVIGKEQKTIQFKINFEKNEQSRNKTEKG